MKTIAILSDPSENSHQAALYALHLARRIQANLVLYQVCVPVPRPELVSSTPYAPNDDAGSNQDSYDKLQSLSVKLQNTLNARTIPGCFLPEITFDAESSEIVDIMTSIVNNDDIIFIVTTIGQGKDISGFAQSDQAREIIDWATVPVLVVPELVEIRNPEKIAFVSNLALADADHINAMEDILESFFPELMVSYVVHKVEKSGSNTGSENSLLTHIVSLANYGRIYFPKITPDRLFAWHWLKDHKKCDILALPPQSSGELIGFFSSGNSPQMTCHVPVPVMFLPALH